ncbi:MAG: polymer-forming cytoskeletal protein [Pseudomonadota bacterium]|mgnify:FL=1|nr:polymer-forming cytoskeletal protein [Pseudomonadota bacterium]
MNLNSIKKRKPRTSRVDSLVGKKARVLGEIRFSEGLHIDGLIKGNVVSDDDQPATLSVSDSGTIEGHVKVPNVIISGTVKGDVYSSEYVELGSTARIEGDVYYGLIEMAMGAEVNGKLVRIIDSDKKVETTSKKLEKAKYK